MLKLGKIALIFGSIVLGTVSGYAAVDASLDKVVTPALSVPVSKASFGRGLDPIVTGRRITPEHLSRWEKMRSESEKCEECVVSQPFPAAE